MYTGAYNNEPHAVIRASIGKVIKSLAWARAAAIALTTTYQACSLSCDFLLSLRASAEMMEALVISPDAGWSEWQIHHPTELPRASYSACTAPMNRKHALNALIDSSYRGAFCKLHSEFPMFDLGGEFRISTRMLRQNSVRNKLEIWAPAKALTLGSAKIQATTPAPERRTYLPLGDSIHRMKSLVQVYSAVALDYGTSAFSFFSTVIYLVLNKAQGKKARKTQCLLRRQYDVEVQNQTSPSWA
ncbi:hypothetical protein C8J57DRAFT_1251384 [Mycena rebaudengoi]|nr:hypothetical protein C8J57DRAFT_1251384 [Mycena rebaudengoi]